MGDDQHDERHTQDTTDSGGEGKPRRRRRRRRRKKTGEGAPETESGEQRGGGERRSGGGGGGRKSRGGRGGRGGRGDRGRRDEGDSHDDADAGFEKQPRQPVDADKIADWEEIFGDQTFADLGLADDVVQGCTDAGFLNPTKIQAELIPLMLTGKDVLGQSRTGSGKTAAFGLPLLHMCEPGTAFQALILAPTRELAIQIAGELELLGRTCDVELSAVYGGQRVSTQAERLEAGPEIIVATPGRLLDMVERGHITLENIRFAVLDEVDRMLDIGFRDEIRKILKRIKTDHQTVFVSATISDEIEKLARQFMHEPEKLIASGGSLTVSLVEQHYFTVEPWDKRRLLLHMLRHEEPELTLVFCRTKRTVDNLAKYLKDKGIDAHAIHGDMYQGKRNSVMKRLRAGSLGALVASDLAARGLDVEGISHVVNYDLPEDPEIYVHRIGRTARGGRGGKAWSFVTPDQGNLLTQIEVLTNVHIPHQAYPDFEPGPVPDDIRKERERASERVEQMRGQNRYAADVPIPAPAAANDARFPGGVVPTKMPPKRMRGKVRTGRSGGKTPADVPAPDAKPDENKTDKD